MPRAAVAVCVLVGLVAAATPARSDNKAVGATTAPIGPTALDGLVARLRGLLARGDGGPEVRGVLGDLDAGRRALVLRRLAEADAAGLDRLVAGLCDGDLRALTRALARLEDPIGARLLVERLAPATWERLLTAGRAGLSAADRGRLDALTGGPDAARADLAARGAAAVTAARLDAARRLGGVPLLGPRLAEGPTRDAAARLAALRATDPAGYARVVARLAADRGGAAADALLVAAGRAAPGEVDALVAWLARSPEGADVARALGDALSDAAWAALLAAAGRLPAEARGTLEARLGGAAAIEARRALLRGTGKVTRSLLDLAAEGAEVVVDLDRATPPDHAWLARVEAAVAAQDDARLAPLLEAAGPRRFWLLWERLPLRHASEPGRLRLPFEPAQYLDVLRTRPGAEVWRVLWCFSKDVDADVVRQLAPRLPLRVVQGRLRPTLQFIRKEFWVTGPDGLEGGTTSAYHPARLGSGEFTPNTVRLGEHGGRRVAVMLYRERPWFEPTLGVGFYDLFVPLTRNIIISPGCFGRYGAPTRGASPWQFYMLRVDPRTERPVQGGAGLAGAVAPGS